MAGAPASALCSQSTIFLIRRKTSSRIRHFADLLHVEGLRPRAVKQKDRDTGRRDYSEERYFPAVSKKATAAASFCSSSPRASEEFHCRRVKSSKRWSGKLPLTFNSLTLQRARSAGSLPLHVARSGTERSLELPLLHRLIEQFYYRSKMSRLPRR